MATDIGLTAEERHELAEFVFGVDGGSWRELTSSQLEELITMLEGFILISFLRSVHSSD